MPAWGHALKDEQISGVLDYVWTAFVKEPAKPVQAAQSAG